jgi:VanZ family protein
MAAPRFFLPWRKFGAIARCQHTRRSAFSMKCGIVFQRSFVEAAGALQSVSFPARLLIVARIPRRPREESLMRSNPRRLFQLLALLLGGYWATIFTLTHIPSPPIDVEVDHFDKLAHACAYAGLAFLLAAAWSAWRGYRPRILAGVLGLAVLYGAFDELSQKLVPNRTADPLDFFADIVGATAGLACLHLLVSFRRRSIAVGPTEEDITETSAPIGEMNAVEA